MDVSVVHASPPQPLKIWLNIWVCSLLMENADFSCKFSQVVGWQLCCVCVVREAISSRKYEVSVCLPSPLARDIGQCTARTQCDIRQWLSMSWGDLYWNILAELE